MRVTLLIIAAALATSCASNGPRLYSPVLPMEDGTLVTESQDAEEEVTVTRVTRNAQRWCEHYMETPLYTVVDMITTYHGVYGNADAARKANMGANVARKLSLGVVDSRTNTDWKTSLIFKCREI